MARSSSRAGRRGSSRQPIGVTSAAATRPPLVRLAPLVILAAAVLVYANALRGPFLFDDLVSIELNTSIRQVWPVTRFLAADLPGPLRGRPLVSLSLAANYAFGALDPFGYHLVNVSLHALAALLLFGVLRRTVPWLQSAIAPGDTHGGVPPFSALTPHGDSVALVCALLWVVHPLNTEVVNYLTQRTESMMAVWFLAALYFAIRAAASPGQRRWPVAAAVSTWMAALSKEVAFVLPLIVMGWDRTYAFPSFRAAWQARWRLYAAMAASWLLFAVIGRSVYGDSGSMRVSWLTYALNQGPIVLRYLWLSVWPRSLVFDYGVPQTVTLEHVWPSFIALAVLAGGGALLMWRQPRLGFWAAWVFVILAPTSSIVPISTEVGAERRMYLPLVGIVVLLAAGTLALVQRLSRSAVAARRASWTVAIGVVSMLAITTVFRNQDYASALTIWQTSLDRWPHWRAHEHVAIQLRDAGRTDESIAEMRLAAPESRESRHALAAALMEKGELPEAIRRFRELIREDPNAPDMPLVRAELAQALAGSGDRAGAVEEYRAVNALEPNRPRTLAALAIALEDAGDFEAAIAEYRSALAIDPRETVALSRLGLLLQKRGAADESLSLLERANSLDARVPAVKLALAQHLLARGDLPRAEAEARAAVALVPGNPEGRNLLGVALASQGRLDEAAAQFAEALRVNPRDPQATANLAHLDAMRRGGP